MANGAQIPPVYCLAILCCQLYRLFHITFSDQHVSSGFC